jgi:hypothetical protein
MKLLKDSNEEDSEESMKTEIEDDPRGQDNEEVANL